MSGMRHDLRTGRSEQIGMVGAAAAIPGTLAPSLADRGWVDQGVVTGLAAGVTYLLSTVTEDGLQLLSGALAARLGRGAGPGAAGRQRLAELLVHTAAIPTGLAIRRALPRHRDEPTLRCLARRAASRTAMTGIGGTAFAAVEAALTVSAHRLGRRVPATPAAIPTGLGLALALEWQRRMRSGEPAIGDRPAVSWLRSLAVAAGLLDSVRAAAYAERRVSGMAGSALARRLPGTAALWRIGAQAGMLAGLGVGAAALYERAIRRAESGTTTLDAALQALSGPDRLGSTVSGSRDSVVPWGTLGREGRRHCFAGVHAEPPPDRPTDLPDLSIPAVMGEPARAVPVQVYIGLDSAPTIADRVQLALAEMNRAGALDRSLLMLVSPTGSGYVNYCAVAAAEYLTRGDVATVTLQYAKRPSLLSLGKVKDGREQNRLLWLHVARLVRDRPAGRRPRVVLFGESLGAHTSQDVLMHWGTLGPQALGIDRALWIGTPRASRWAQQVTSGGRPDVVPALVAVLNDFDQLTAMPPDRRRRLRYVLLSHDNDAVTKFGVDLLVRQPGWLGEHRPSAQEVPGASPRGVPASMRWRPVTTFFQLLVDLKNSQAPDCYQAWAHDYRPDLPRFIREVFDLECSEEQLARIEQALVARETIRESLFTGSVGVGDRHRGANRGAPGGPVEPGVRAGGG